MAYLYDRVSEEDISALLAVIARERPEPDMAGIDPMPKYNAEKQQFLCLNAREMVKILRDLREMPPRTRIREVPMELRAYVMDNAVAKYFPEQS